MPGHGSHYSFRTVNYRIARLSDLRFDGANFTVAGVLRHAIMTGIGDIPLDQVNQNSTGLKYLNDFQPVTSVTMAAEVDRVHVEGMDSGGYYYGQALRAMESMTYVLRSVAYRGNLYRSIGATVYDEIDFDKRSDITVAFRIIRKHSDGSITVIWNQLFKEDSPSLKVDRRGKGKIKNSKFIARGNPE